MDRYQKVEKPRPEQPISESEIRITSQGLIRNYISYATSLLQEKRVEEIVLKAMGQAISKTVAVAEIIKKNIPGLYQDISVSSISITDVWEPIEEGLVPVEMTRRVSIISISLSARDLNRNSPGYQAPTDVEWPRPQRQYYQQRWQQQPPPTDGVYSQGNGRGRGRVRGRGLRGRGRYGGGYRGGYSGYYDNGYSSGYSGYYDNGYSSGYGGDYDDGYYGSHRDDYAGGYGGGYGNNHVNDRRWSNQGGQGRNGGYRGAGYERGRSQGARGYSRGGGRLGRGRGNESY